MYSHNVVGSNDLDRSRTFYDALFGAIGAGPANPAGENRFVYGHGGSMFLVTKPINGEPATPGNGCTIGFGLDSPEQVDAWHAAGVAAGGTSVEDPPGVRDMGFAKLYLAYLRDPDGNKLCAMKALG